ncbi:MAG: hypothetical protein KDK55_06195 [Chlamydiia bacterium]|nr:hypothetical protein [Chlamydiia bacterium]
MNKLNKIISLFMLLYAVNLSVGLSFSNSEEFTLQILEFSVEVNSQKPFTKLKSTRDASKLPENEEVKPNTQIVNLSPLGAFESPTEKYLKTHTLDEIKYNLRLDNVSLIYNDLFDKAISKEIEGFVGYHGDSLEYRVYQDVIKIILEEVVGIEIPKDFHFLDIPCFRKQVLQELVDIPKFFQPERNLGMHVQRQLFPINIALYSNHNRIGFTSVSNFTLNVSKMRSTLLEADLKKFFQSLGMEPSIVEEALLIGKTQLKEDRGILLQIFDDSEEPYGFVNNVCYPAYPNGYPFANRVISEYYYDEAISGYPTEIKMLLTDRYTLNPNAPITITRFDKIQPSIVKGYEMALRELIKGADYDPQQVEGYHQTLMHAWMQ